MADYTMNISPFMSMIIGLLFVFSTIYGLMYYFYLGDQQTVQLESLNSTDKNATEQLSDSGGFLSGYITGAVDSFFSLISWVSPFALIRGAIYTITPTELFIPIDIFILRPMSWAVMLITGNWILSSLRGKSEG